VAEAISLPFEARLKLSDKPPHVMLEHFHAGYELQLVINASYQLFVREENYAVSARELVFIDEYNLHKLIYDQNAPCERYIIHFKRSFVQNFLRTWGGENLLDELSKKPSSHINLAPATYENVRSLFERLCDLSSDAEMSPDKREGLIKSALFLLLETIRSLLPDAREEIHTKKQDQVRAIIHYLDEHFAEDITLEQLEKVFFLTKYHICHIFKEVTGFSLFSYLQHRRVIEAQRLLRVPGTKATDICYQCGFSGVQQFYKVFKKVVNLTPRAYAKRYAK